MLIHGVPEYTQRILDDDFSAIHELSKLASSRQYSSQLPTFVVESPSLNNRTVYLKIAFLMQRSHSHFCRIFGSGH
jgi:hypothetical protein